MGWYSLGLLAYLCALLHPASAKLLAGGLHSFHSIQANGQVFGFGRNSFGALGDNTTVNRYSPVPMLGVTDAVDISSTHSFVCIVTDSVMGSVYCAGQNDQAQLGDGSPLAYRALAAPVPALNAMGGVKQVFAGKSHACAVLAQSGALRCWGKNAFGALGDGTANNIRPTPVPAIGFETGGVAQVALGLDFTCVATLLGTVMCTGSNKYRALGDGSTEASSTFQLVIGLETNFITNVAAGSHHTCALDARAGLVLCWGMGSYGQLGSARNVNSAIPIQPVGLPPIAQVFCGPETTMVIHQNGTNASVFGRNAFGQFGTPVKSQFNSPMRFTAATTASAQEDALREIQSAHSALCVLRESGLVQCLGSDTYGQLGRGITGGATVAATSLTMVDVFGTRKVDDANVPSLQPTYAPPPKPYSGPEPRKLLAAGRSHFCALQWDGKVYCFGSNKHGELGDGTLVNRAAPVEMRQPFARVMDISAAEYYTCLVSEDGLVRCVGGGVPQQAALANISQVFCGKTQMCALSNAHELTCFGNAETSTMDSVVQAAVGDSHTCLVTALGQVLCTGSNKYAQLGDGTQRDNTTSFIPVLGLDAHVMATVAVGTWHTCALSRRGRVFCWGLVDAESGTLQISPVSPPGLESGVVFLSITAQNTMVVHNDGGSASCLGSNAAGQFALGNNAAYYGTPVAFARGARRNILEIRATQYSICILDEETGAVQCAGSDMYGELGRGGGGGSAAPVSLVLVDAMGLPVGVTLAPSSSPSNAPSSSPSISPSSAPSSSPSSAPTPRDTDVPTVSPSLRGATAAPTAASTTPVTTEEPTMSPTNGKVVDDASKAPTTSGTSIVSTSSPTVNNANNEDSPSINLVSPFNGVVLLLAIAFLAIPVVMCGRRGEQQQEEAVAAAA